MYLEVDEALFEHPKSNKLCAALRNPLAWGYVIKLWRWCCKYAKDGDLSRFGDEEIEYGLGWTGEPGALMSAIRTSGFIERTSDGRSVVHDWMKGQGKALAKMEADAERKRLSRLSGGHPTDGARTSNGHPAPVRVTAPVPNQTKPSKDPPVSPASGGAVFKLEATRKPTRAEKAAARKAKHEADATAVLDALNAARTRCIPGARALSPTPENLRNIADRLESNTLDDCLHVVAVAESDYLADPLASEPYFNAVTPFRPDNFARNLGRQPGGRQATATSPTPAAHRPMPPIARPAS